MQEVEKTRCIKFAERYWKNHGYEFETVKVYRSRVDYVIRKDGYAMKYKHPAVVDDNPGIMRLFEYSWDLFKRGVDAGAWPNNT